MNNSLMKSRKIFLKNEKHVYKNIYGVSVRTGE